jgi:hypothetical protein
MRTHSQQNVIVPACAMSFAVDSGAICAPVYIPEPTPLTNFATGRLPLPVTAQEKSVRDEHKIRSEFEHYFALAELDGQARHRIRSFATAPCSGLELDDSVGLALTPEV